MACGARMFDRLLERFRKFDDFYFCNAVRAEWKAMLLTDSKASDRQYGPEGGLADSGIMTLLVLHRGARFKNSKTFYNGIVLAYCGHVFPVLPAMSALLRLRAAYGRFWFFLASRMSRKTGIYYIDSTPLPVCHNQRIAKHKVFAGPAARERPAWAGFPASNCMSGSTIGARSLRSNCYRCDHRLPDRSLAPAAFPRHLAITNP